MKVIKNGYPWCSRWYVEIDESAYCSSTGMDYSELTRIYVYPDCSHDCNITKCLKKAWKHYNKLAYQKMKEHDFRIEVRVNAYIESEYGDVEDISWVWICEQMEYEEEKTEQRIKQMYEVHNVTELGITLEQYKEDFIDFYKMQIKYKVFNGTFGEFVEAGYNMQLTDF